MSVMSNISSRSPTRFTSRLAWLNWQTTWPARPRWHLQQCQHINMSNRMYRCRQIYPLMKIKIHKIKKQLASWLPAVQHSSIAKPVGLDEDDLMIVRTTADLLDLLARGWFARVVAGHSPSPSSPPSPASGLSGSRSRRPAVACLFVCRHRAICPPISTFSRRPCTGAVQKGDA